MVCQTHLNFELSKIGDKSLNVPQMDRRKLSEVSDIASQIDSLINNLNTSNNEVIKPSSPCKLVKLPYSLTTFNFALQQSKLYFILVYNI